MCDIRLNITNPGPQDMYLSLPDDKDLMPWQIMLFKVNGNERVLVPTSQSSSCLQREHEVKGKRFYQSVMLTQGQSYEIVLHLPKILQQPLEPGNYEIHVHHYSFEFKASFVI